MFDVKDGIQISKSVVINKDKDVFAKKVTASGGAVINTGSWNKDGLRLNGAAPSIYFSQDDGSNAYLGFNGNNFYILADTDSNGTFSSPYALELDITGNALRYFGHKVYHEGHKPTYSELGVIGHVSTSFANQDLNTASTPTFGALTVNGGIRATSDIHLDSASHANLYIDRASLSHDNNIMFRTAGSTKWRLWMNAEDSKIGFRYEASGAEPLRIYENNLVARGHIEFSNLSNADSNGYYVGRLNGTGGTTVSSLTDTYILADQNGDGTVQSVRIKAGQAGNELRVTNSVAFFGGQYISEGHIISGSGRGGAALTINDGQGNANLTFNHVNGVPEVNGNAGRIEFNKDSTSNAGFSFEVASNVTAGQAVATTPVLWVSDVAFDYKGFSLYHEGHKPTYSELGTITTGFVDFANQMLNTNSTPYFSALTVSGYGNTHFNHGSNHDIYLTTGSSGRLMTRTYNGTGYGTAYDIYHTGHKVVEYGGASTAEINDTNSPTFIKDISATAEIGLSGWNHIINMAHQNGNGYGSQIAVEFGASPRIRFRGASGTAFGSWKEFYTEDHKPTITEIQGGSSANNYTFNGSVSLNDVNVISFKDDNSLGSVSISKHTDDWLRYRFGSTGDILGVQISNYDTPGIYLSRNGWAKFTSDEGLTIEARTNGAGAKLTFSDHAASDYAQKGFIEYFHADGAAGVGANDGFVISGTEANTVVRVEGRLDVGNNTVYHQGYKQDHIPSQGSVTAMPTGRSALSSGIHHYGTDNSTSNTPHSSKYGESIVWGEGTAGSVEIWGGWVGSGWGKLYTRALRNVTDNWSSWYEIYTSRDGVPWDKVSNKPSLAILNGREGYWGLPSGSDGGSGGFIRTPSSGLLPYQSGGASDLGTSGWKFNNLHVVNGYIDSARVYGNATIDGNIVTDNITLDSTVDEKVNLRNRDDSWNYVLFTRSDGTRAWEVGVKGGTSNNIYAFRGKNASNDVARDILQLNYSEDRAYINNLTVSGTHGRTVIQASGTIASTSAGFNNGWLQVGTSSDGWTIDPNEIYCSSSGNIGTFSGDLNLNPAGMVKINGGVRLDNVASDILQVTNSSGWVRIGANNTGYAHLYTDRPWFYMDKGIRVDGTIQVYDKMSQFTGDGNHALIGATSSYFARISNNGDIARINTGWANNATEQKILRNSYASNVGDYIQIQPSGNRTTNGTLVIGTNSFGVGLHDLDGVEGNTRIPFTDTWLSVDTTDFWLSGKRVIRHSDSWLRLNEDTSFSSGIYCGGSTLRTDGNLQVGNGGAALNANTSQIDLKVTTRVHGRMHLKEIVSQDGNFTTIGAGELGGYLYGHVTSIHGVGNEGVHIGGESGVYLYSHPSNMTGDMAASYSIRVLATDGASYLNHLDVYKDQNNASQLVARFRHPNQNANIAIVAKNSNTGSFRFEANADGGDLRVQTADTAGNYSAANGDTGTIAQFYRNGDFSAKKVLVDKGTSEANIDLVSSSETCRFFWRGSDDNFGLYINAATRLRWTGSNDRWTASGEIWATDLVATSDIRVKTNLKSIESALTKIEKIEGFTYDHTRLDKRKAGIIAQDVQKVLPEAVSSDDEGILSVSTLGVTGLVVNAVKELKRENDKLKTENADLKNTLNQVLARLDSLENK